MARIASEAKAGYYPTPPSQVLLIAQRLRVEPGAKVNIFDPCAGEGDALHGFAQALSGQGAVVTSYGIELEKERAEKCRGKLDHVLQSPYEDTRVTPHSMSFMWLNPPYTNRGHERAEVAFLRDLTDPVSGKLQPGGLLGFCIPQKVLKNAAMLLALRFEDIHVYRFTDDEYPAFHQVVVFAKRREKKNPDPTPEGNRLKELSLAELPPLDVNDGRAFHIPATERDVQTFLLNVLTEEEVAQTLAASPVWEMIAKYKPVPKAIMKPPVMPLKSTHIAVAIAAGAVGGNMGDHLLVGSTKRVTSSEEIPVENGMKVIERTESKSVIRLFNRNGIHVLE